MVAADEDALRCDFAQVYHVLDYRRLPLRTAAVFAQGLPEDSRIMRRLSGARVDLRTALLARLVDGVMTLVWQQTKDGHNGRNPPRSVFDILMGGGDNEKPRAYASAADFRTAWREITGEVN